MNNTPLHSSERAMEPFQQQLNQFSENSKASSQHIYSKTHHQMGNINVGQQ